MKALEITWQDIDQAVKLLQAGKVGVIPTDTIYGLVGSALNPEVVEQIYTLRQREKGKPFIILISAIDDLKKFAIVLTKEQKDFLEQNWPNPLSVILATDANRFKYLHRGKASLAFRMPENKKLLELIKQTGPLVAPSANLAGEKPAGTVEEAKKYFNDKVAFYVMGEKITSKPSTIIQLYEDGTKIILRAGSFKV